MLPRPGWRICQKRTLAGSLMPQGSSEQSPISGTGSVVASASVRWRPISAGKRHFRNISEQSRTPQNLAAFLYRLLSGDRNQ